MALSTTALDIEALLDRSFEVVARRLRGHP
jgi:hypothetical protein